jgi:hypothetical protein
VSLIKSQNSWVFFDDENVAAVTEQQVQTTFGSTHEFSSANMDHGVAGHRVRVQIHMSWMVVAYFGWPCGEIKSARACRVDHQRLLLCLAAAYCNTSPKPCR